MTDRREFIKKSAMAAMGVGFMNMNAYSLKEETTEWQKGKRIGMIGLDTGHCAAFTQSLNAPDAKYNGYRVVAACPKGTDTIKEWKDRIPGITEEVRKQGVEIVNSTDELLKKVDVVLMTCIDGNKHLELALPVLKAGKPLFIDKPFAGSLTDAFAIAEAARKYNVPMFSSSSLRYMNGLDKLREDVGEITGTDAYSPAHREEHHPDLFWYGVHGVEILFAIMGVGCQSVKRTTTEHTDYVVGVWEGGRIGTYRGIRHGKGDYGVTVFGEKGIKALASYSGYEPLLVKITEFYDSRVAPVSIHETLEIFAFMEAAEESKKQGGTAIDMVALMKNR